MSSDSSSSIRTDLTGSPLAADSSYTSSDDEGDVISLTPSITDYPIRWGRRYHKYKEGTYLLPNDEAESHRLDYQHGIIKQLHGGRLFFAPIVDPRRILDIGTGTGIWPVELADSGLVPNAKITGTDLSPIQPSDVPERVQFEIADYTDSDWLRPRDSVDFIHMRMMTHSLKPFQDFFTTAKKYLRPGGWLEIHDIDTRLRSDDDSSPENWPFCEWERMCSKGIRKLNKQGTLHIASKLRKWMEEAGFEDVTEIVYKLPLGAWPKNREMKAIGRGWASVVLDGLPAFSYKVLGNDGLEMSREEVEVCLADVRKCIVDRDVHGYFNFHTVYGRKPNKK